MEKPFKISKEQISSWPVLTTCASDALLPPGGWPQRIELDGKIFIRANALEQRWEDGDDCGVDICGFEYISGDLKLTIFND